MRQGEVASQGKWTGNQQGGVNAPEPLILPDPATRFARTAARLNALSAGHPMAEWLRFMAELAEAQHVVAATMGPVTGPTQAIVERAVEARLPVLAAELASQRPDLARGSRPVDRPRHRRGHPCAGAEGHGEPARPWGRNAGSAGR